VRLMKIDEVARVLDVPVDRGYALARKGVIPVVRIGRQVRIDRDQLAAWIEGGGWELDAKAEAGEQT
jgi:excisionase family DNA binding protein